MGACSPQNLPPCVQNVKAQPVYVCDGHITVEDRYTYHESCMIATTAGTGYAEGDLILVTRVYDNEVNPPEFVEAFYLNANTQETIDPADINGGTFEQCPTDTVVTWSICLQDDNGKFTRLFAKDLETDVVVFQNHDRVTGADYTTVGDITECLGDNDYISQGYVEECTQFDTQLNINQSGTISIQAEGTVTTDVITLALIGEQLREAKELQDHLTQHGLPVENFTILTTSGSIEFPPNSGEVSGTAITINPTDIVSWGTPEATTILSISYSYLSNCTCFPVEMHQRIDRDGNVVLVDIIDPSKYDPVTMVKPSLLGENGLLPFGTIGAFAGLCETPEQVLENNDLCCNDDILNSMPDLSQTFIGWLDAATELDNLLDTGGNPIAGAGGERVHTVVNPLGTGEDWDGQGPNDGAHYELNLQNGLPGLVFDGGPLNTLNSGDHYELLTGSTADNAPFTIFYLLRPAPLDEQIGGIPLTVTGANNNQLGWEINYGAGNPLIFRYRPVSTTPLVDIEIAPVEEFTDGAIHLITMRYTGGTDQNMEIWFDGELRLNFNVVDAADGEVVNFLSSVIRIMNSLDDAHPSAGQVFETIYSNEALSEDSVAFTNAYIICKWGIDPSLAAGGAGDLTLFEAGSFSSETNFIQQKLASGRTQYINTTNGQVFSQPPVPGLSVCGSDEVVTTILTETGCLSSPASVDLGNVQRCNLKEVHIGSDIFTVDISPGWSVQELVDAVNAEQPDLLSVDGSSVLIQNGVSLQNLTLVCRDDIFLEDFGVGGTDGNRVSTAATNYTFQNNGMIVDGEYGITSFQDTGLAVYHTGEGNITADSQGDANGNAFFVGADAIPGELYRRSENVTKNREYSVSLFVIDTTIAAATLSPNLDIIIEDDQGNELVVHNTGDIVPRDRQWREINFDFVAITPNIEFVIRNAGQGGFGNDFAVDHITFNEVTRQNFKMTSTGSVVPVEIVKVIDPDGGISSLRVFSPDGETEYISPYDGLILSTGDCVVLGDSGIEPIYESQIVEEYEVVTTSGTIEGNLQSYSITNIGNADGTVNGNNFHRGASISFSAYLDPVANQFNRLSGVSYDATGTEFIITRIP